MLEVVAYETSIHGVGFWLDVRKKLVWRWRSLMDG